MTKNVRGTKSPMNTGTLKRVMMALVVLLLASALLVGAGSANTEGELAEETAVAKIEDKSYESLAAAISDVKIGTTETTIIELADGTHDMPTISANAAAGAKNITITGSKKAEIKVGAIIAYACEITFNGVTVNNTAYTPFMHSKKVVYNECDIKGLQKLHAIDVEFTNCTLTNLNDYCLWTYGSKNVTFTSCTFNTGGKAINVYNEHTTSSFVSNVTLTNCTFNDDGTLNTIKAAVETGSNGGNTATSNKYNIVFTGCTVNDFAINDEGINTGSNYWSNKNSMDKDHLIVVIDGVEVTDVYTVTWVDHNGAELEKDERVLNGTMPKYDKATPSRADTAEYKYQFTGWTPEVTKVTGDATYKATFAEIPVEVKSEVTVETKVEGNNVTLTAPENPTLNIAGSTIPDTEEAVKNAVKDAGNITIAGSGTDATKVVVNYAPAETDSIIVKEEGQHKLIVGKISNMTIVNTKTNVEIVMEYTIAVNATTNTTSGQTTVEDKPSAVVATYPEASIETSAEVSAPVQFELELQLKPEEVLKEELVLPKIVPTFVEEVAEKHATDYGVKPLAMLTAEMPDGGSTDEINKKLDKVVVTFTISKSVYDESNGGKDIYVLHVKNNGDVVVLEPLNDEFTASADSSTYQFAVEGDGFSSYIATIGTPQAPATPQKDTSSSSGSSVWLTETPTPTQTPTAQPTDAVPTDIPVTQPTETPASPAFGALAVLAGLGAVAVLRRK